MNETVLKKHNWKNCEIKIVTGDNKNVKKYVFKTPDAMFEAVVYKYKSYNKRTVICCSVQSGCPVGCTFCGTGHHFVRNLYNIEIRKQIATIIENERIKPELCKKFQIMFMSMGEPMYNWDEVRSAILALSLKYPNAQLLLSTVGIQDMDVFNSIIQTSQLVAQVGLQFSIHNSIEEERDKIIPHKNKMPLGAISRCGTAWNKATYRKPFINYCVTKDNHTEEHIKRLMELFPPEVFNITFSTVCSLDKTQEDKTDYDGLYTMQSKFLDAGYNVRVFDPAGKDDIGGGCGQLWFVQEWLKERANG